MKNLLNVYIKPEDISVVMVDDVVRDEDQGYCVQIKIWVNNLNDPFIFTYLLLEAEYDESKIFGIVYSRKLRKYNSDMALTHPNLLQDNLKVYLNDLAKLNIKKSLFKKEI